MNRFIFQYTFIYMYVCVRSLKILYTKHFFFKHQSIFPPNKTHWFCHLTDVWKFYYLLSVDFIGWAGRIKCACQFIKQWGALSSHLNTTKYSTVNAEWKQLGTITRTQRGKAQTDRTRSAGLRCLMCRDDQL